MLFGTILVLYFLLTVSAGKPYISTSTYVPTFFSVSHCPEITWNERKKNVSLIQNHMPCAVFFKHIGQMPPLPLNLLVTKSQIHCYGTRTASDCWSNLRRTNSKQFTILYKGSKIWNSLSTTASRSSNRLSFKMKMQEYFSLKITELAEPHICSFYSFFNIIL